MGKNVGVVLALKDKCSPTIIKVAQKFGMTADAAEKLNKRLRAQARLIDEKLKPAMGVFTGAVTAATGAIGMLAYNSSQVSDRIDDMSNKIGISRQGFQEWDYLLQQNGGNIESLQMGFKTLTNQVSKANTGNKESAKIFKTLGISIKDSNGKLKTQEEIFNELVPALQRMPEGVQKAKIANDLLGRSGSELMPLFNATTEQVAKQREEYKKLGLAISDDVIDSGNLLGDNIAKWQSIFKSFGASLGGEIIPILNNLSDTFITELPKIKATVTPIVTGLAKVVNFACENLHIIVPAITAVVGAFTALKVVSAVTGFVAAFCNPVGLAVVGITALIAGLGVAYAKFEGFRSTVGAVVSVVKMLAVFTWNVIKPILKFSFAIASWITPIGQVIRLLGLLGKGINNVAQFFGGWTKIGNSVKNWADSNTSKMTQKHALGTSSASGGLSLVGEYGPELVNIPKGSSVTPANKTRQFLGGQSSNISIPITINGNVYGEDDLFNKIISKFTLELNKVIPV